MDEQRYRLAELIIESVPALMRTLAADLRKSDQMLAPAHFGVLVMLAEGGCSISELAGTQSVSVPSMSSSVTTLVERGWIERLRSASDRRVARVSLTAKGLEIMAHFREMGIESVASMLGELEDEDLDAMVAGFAVLKKIVQRTVTERIGQQCQD